jgi:hypothetical protein
MRRVFMILFVAAILAVSAGLASAMSIDSASSWGSVNAPSENNMSNASSNIVSPLLDKTDTYMVAANDPCCPAGYPWYRNSTGRCYNSYSDCHDTNGGGWSCRQVNQCN